MGIFNLEKKRRGRRRNYMTEKTTRTRTRFDVHIPVEIISEILFRLPVKSILRFKSVCKTWYGVIQNPNFNKKHNEQSSRKSNPFLIDRGLNNDYKFRYSVVHRNGTYNEPFDNNYYLNLDEDLKIVLYVVGISNGLVCMRNKVLDDQSVYIFNPATKQFRQYQEVWKLGYAVELFVVGTEFGSDSNYSLLSVGRRTCNNGTSVTVCVQKCNISTGTEWRNMNLKISNVLHDLVTYEFDEDEYGPIIVTTVMVHGVFYWGLDCCGKWLVACLNICNATYDEIRIPEALVSSSANDPDLIELKGELALILYGVPQDYMLEFWFLNESGRKWTKKLTIKESRIYFYRVLGCVRNGELLVHRTEIQKSKFVCMI